MRKVTLGAALLLLAIALPAAADPGSELDRVRERQEEVEAQKEDKLARAASVTDRLAELDRARERVEERVEDLASKVAALDAKIERTEAELTEAQKELAFLEARLDVIERRLDRKHDVLTDRVVEAYMEGPTGYLDSLLSSSDFGELVDRIEYRTSAMDTESQLIARIEVLQDKTEARERLAEEKKLEIAAAKATLEDDRREVDAKRDEHAAVLAEKEAVLDEKRTLLADLRDDARRLAALEAQLEADESRLVSIIQAAVPTSAGPAPVGGGQLLIPAAGPITSPYGYRTHPIFGDQRLHTGIDIGAGYGAPVVAADAGTVVYAGTMSGYGNVIAIDHGGGLSTTYNHLSAFYVGSGQSVGRGTTIGGVGCTGYCTGPHLHFEVRINGSPVDPMPYLQ
ncbi:MAG TPA: peptidoglycan DD-metalloendopeptidase family protein [Actinomycetota bacterium]|nr:peptidoglycan DD-metalloendopeptidase family protein [Actinomycetota bacterium]